MTDLEANEAVDGVITVLHEELLVDLQHFAFPAHLYNIIIIVITIVIIIIIIITTIIIVVIVILVFITTIVFIIDIVNLMCVKDNFASYLVDIIVEIIYVIKDRVFVIIYDQSH